MSQAKMGRLSLRTSRTHKSSGSLRVNRPGFTLVEVLVATVVTLLMMVSLAQVFKLIGDSMKQGRAALELNSRLRNVAYRIQLDLNNCTVTPKPGSESVNGTGYMKIYDGPLTDYSYGLISSAFNRFGDADDILMFTARAGDDWFVGKVPLFVLQKVAPAAGNTDLVTITAQHAEIVLFAEPTVTNESNPNRDPYYLRMNPAENYAKLTNPGTGAVTDLPSGYRLHYRTLLIRPDLNLTTGELPFGTVGTSDWLVARSTGATFTTPSGTTTITLPSPTCDMTIPHQQCDLSMRRVDPFSAVSSVAANSLEDLSNPANRFAHVQIPLVAGTPGPDYSMPVLALSPKIDSAYTLAEPGNLISAPSTLPLEHQSGFIHPAFMLTGDRTGEDVLASDVLAFDVKGYDPAVPLYALTTGGIVSPNDPGYGTALSDASNTAVGQGEFVDVGWGRKAQVHFVTPTYSTPIATRLAGQLSGVVANSTLPFSEALYKSGLALQSGTIPFPPAYSPNLVIFQPSYDTWHSKYEGDGVLQSEIAGANVRGLMHLRGASAPKDTFRVSGSTYVPDCGTDGIDNNASAGVDDLAELETSPPFPMDLRGVKVTIRMEDSSARTFNQMTVTKEFVTQ